MGAFFRAYRNWGNRKKTSDIAKIKVTDSGAFYMRTEDLFDDREESLLLLKKLNESVENHRKSSKKVFAHSE